MARASTILAALLLMAGCAEGEGIVELHWQFDDTSLRRIFPLGAEPDTCAMPSTDSSYDLIVRLRVLENSAACLADTDGPDCVQIAEELFDCHRSRGTAYLAPSEDAGYLMVVEALIDPAGEAEAFVPVPSCIATPGPRVRQVRPGRITDLEIYEFVVFAIDVEPTVEGEKKLDIESCRGE